MNFLKKAHNYLSHYGLKSFFYLAKLIYMHLSPKKEVTRKINDEYKMCLDLKDKGISQALYLYGTRERDQVHIVRKNIRTGMKVLDIGANIGYYALLEASMVGDKGKVYAFEPHPGNVEALKRNITINKFSERIEFKQMGMSDTDGMMEFHVSPRSNLHTLNPTSFKGKRKDKFDNSIKIDVLDITNFLLEKEDIDFVRMDIEGHEVEVLNGLFRGLNSLKKMPSILFEAHFPKYDDKHHDMRQVLTRLIESGYHVDKIVSNNERTSPLKMLNYKPQDIVRTDGVYRGIYSNVEDKDAVNFICDTGGIRAVLLKHRTSQ